MNPKIHLKSFTIDKTTGEKICNCGCGKVEESNMPTMEYQEGMSSEDLEKKNKRVGPPENIFLHDKGLHTEINYQNKDFNGAKLDSKNSQLFYNLREWQKRIVVSDPVERRLYGCIAEISRMGSNLEVTNTVLHNAIIMCRRAIINHGIHNLNYRHFGAVCLFICCRDYGRPISSQDICEKLSLKQKLFRKYFRIVTWETSIAVTEHTTPQTWLQKLSVQLQLDKKVTMMASKIINICSDKNLTPGRNPKGVAGAAIYLSCKQVYGKFIHNGKGYNKLRQDELSEMLGLTAVTIRNIMTDIVPELKKQGLIKIE